MVPGVIDGQLLGPNSDVLVRMTGEFLSRPPAGLTTDPSKQTTVTMAVNYF